MIFLIILGCKTKSVVSHFTFPKYDRYITRGRILNLCVSVHVLRGVSAGIGSEAADANLVHTHTDTLWFQCEFVFIFLKFGQWCSGGWKERLRKRWRSVVRLFPIGPHRASTAAASLNGHFVDSRQLGWGGTTAAATAPAGAREDASCSRNTLISCRFLWAICQTAYVYVRLCVRWPCK